MQCTAAFLEHTCTRPNEQQASGVGSWPKGERCPGPVCMHARPRTSRSSRTRSSSSGSGRRHPTSACSVSAVVAASRSALIAALSTSTAACNMRRRAGSRRARLWRAACIARVSLLVAVQVSRLCSTTVMGHGGPLRRRPNAACAARLDASRQVCVLELLVLLAGPPETKVERVHDKQVLGRQLGAAEVAQVDLYAAGRGELAAGPEGEGDKCLRLVPPPGHAAT